MVAQAITAYTTVHTPQMPPPAGKVTELPAHVAAIVNRHNDGWAREMVAGRARELYEECGDWSKVTYQLDQEDSTE